MDFLDDLEAPRVERTRLHSLHDILVTIILAVICGADSWTDVELFGCSKHDWLSTFLFLHCRTAFPLTTPMVGALPCWIRRRWNVVAAAGRDAVGQEHTRGSHDQAGSVLPCTQYAGQRQWLTVAAVNHCRGVTDCNSIWVRPDRAAARRARHGSRRGGRTRRRAAGAGAARPPPTRCLGRCNALEPGQWPATRPTPRLG